jgi:hypothetical protein
VSDLQDILVSQLIEAVNRGLWGQRPNGENVGCPVNINEGVLGCMMPPSSVGTHREGWKMTREREGSVGKFNEGRETLGRCREITRNIGRCREV